MNLLLTFLDRGEVLGDILIALLERVYFLLKIRDRKYVTPTLKIMGFFPNFFCKVYPYETFINFDNDKVSNSCHDH